RTSPTPIALHDRCPARSWTPWSATKGSARSPHPPTSRTSASPSPTPPTRWSMPTGRTTTRSSSVSATIRSSARPSAPGCSASGKPASTTPRRGGPRVRPIPRTGRLAAASSLSARTPPPQCRPCLREAYLAPGSHPHESRQPTHELSSCPGFPYIEKLGQLESWHPVHPESVRSRVTAPLTHPSPSLNPPAKTPGFPLYTETWRLDALT